MAAQSVFVALLLWAANLRKIEGFLVRALTYGTARRRPRRRRTRSID